MGRMTQQTRDSVQLCLHLFLSNIYIAWQSAVEDGNDHITMVKTDFGYSRRFNPCFILIFVIC